VRVLLVEDDAALAAAMCAYLGDKGFAVDRAESLAAARAALPLAPWHAVLLALHLDQPALTQAARIDALTRQCRLSQAERQVLLLLADGDPVDAVARHLGLCVSTVRSHVRNLLGKTQAPSLMQLLRWTGSAQALPH